MNEILTSFINGLCISCNPSAEQWVNKNPANEEVICQVVAATADELEMAIQGARQAQVAWALKTGAERGRVLTRAAQILRDNVHELARLEVIDTGKPLKEALTVDIFSGADALEYFGGIAASLKGEYYSLGRNFAYTRREPLGIVAGIGAWNYPLQIACWKAAPALAAGNAMIFKPSELTPMTASRLAEVFKEAGLPDGLFQVVQGGSSVGEKLVSHPQIHKVSLTGEVSTGKKVMASAAAGLKPVTLELGGKSPLIIFADADLNRAVDGALLANFYTQGEVCSNGTRVYVHRSLMPQFSKLLVEKTQGLKVGDPMDESTEVGALISADHMNKVLGHIDSGKASSAKLLCGGHRVGERGYFVAPTIFSNCNDDMSIVKEEIFGPVLSLLTFDTEDEVINRANNTPYGLAAGVYTQNLELAHRTVDQLQAGICWINTYNETPIEIPFGGYKLSGLGRENSSEALYTHTQIKTVLVGTNQL